MNSTQDNNSTKSTKVVEVPAKKPAPQQKAVAGRQNCFEDDYDRHGRIRRRVVTNVLRF